MTDFTSLSAVIDPVISRIPAAPLRNTLRDAFLQEPAAVRTIEKFFRMFAASRWSDELLYTFAASWKATHLKMLAIYGLSCRLQRAAENAGELERTSLHIAAAKNAATSYEDLGLDYDGHTHAELYEEFAQALTGSDLWQLPRYRLPEAHRFSRWVYRNMVVEAIPDGLLTNMFSEIYNHGEYSMALAATGAYLRQHAHLGTSQYRRAIAYVAAHVEDEVEAAHFLVVVEALDRYLAASNTRLDLQRASWVFQTYLRNLAPVMERLTAMMHLELAGGVAASLPIGNA
jgi:hypothetical protein